MNPQPVTDAAKPEHAVAVLGFNPTEQRVLASIFDMSARRTPKFVRQLDETGTPDVFLVDADDANAMTALQACNRERRIPVILIGKHDQGTGWPRLSRPLQWARLFVAFDLAVRPRSERPPAAARKATDTDVIPGGIARALGVPVAEPQFRRAADGVITHPMPAGGADARRKTGATPRAAETPKQVPQEDVVLVVGEDPAVMDMLRARLGPLRLPLHVAHSGDEALQLSAHRHYCCMFVAVDSAGLDGYQVCKVVKTRRTAKPTAVVLLADHGSPLDRIKAKMVSCDAYLDKPLDDGRLLEVIARYVPAVALA
ncbi:MAG: response regulator [Betaproteobacteria bacterium]|nr:response regulator [Betaproteobacteria bacterium]